MHNLRSLRKPHLGKKYVTPNKEERNIITKIVATMFPLEHPRAAHILNSRAGRIYDDLTNQGEGDEKLHQSY